MDDKFKIYEQLQVERESALQKVRLIDQVFDILHSDSGDTVGLTLLTQFIELNSRISRTDIIKASKMNLTADKIDNYEGYSTAKNLKEKIIVILKKEQKYLTIRELSEVVADLEMEPKKDTEYFIKNISPVLSIAAKNSDKIFKYSEGNKKSTLWGLQEWQEDGIPIQDYLV